MVLNQNGKPHTSSFVACAGCDDMPAQIRVWGYSAGGDIDVCVGCATQLARKLLEDICDVATVGGRHG